MPATRAPFALTEIHGRITLRFPGVSALDCANCDDLGKAMVSAIENRAAPDLTVDLAGVNYLTSMALSQFLKLDHHVRAMGGRLAIVNVHPEVRKVFAISKLDHVLNICDGALAG